MSLLRMMPDLETGDMIGLVSSTGPGLVTEINDPRQLLLLDDLSLSYEAFFSLQEASQMRSI